MKAIEHYEAALLEIRSATLCGKIIWKRTSPESYSYKLINADLEDLVLSLKKFQTNGSPDYLFSLVKKDFDGTEVLLNIDTSSSEKFLKNSLKELFECVEYHVDLRTLDSLKNFIDEVQSNVLGNTFSDH